MLECKSEVPYVIYSGKRTAVDTPQNAFWRHITGKRQGIAVFLLPFKLIVATAWLAYSKPITHVFFLDAYKTWWEDGKSYLCRIIDILNSGLVDEVIVGREIFHRWPELLESIIEE